MKYYRVSWSTNDVIPDPFWWVDSISPYLIFCFGFVILAVTYLK